MAMLREVYELPSDHRWTAKAGYKILALERGAVVLEFPGDWHVQPGPQQVDIRDRATAAESACVLAVSSLPLPPVDWSGLPLASLLLEVVRADEREHIGHGPMTDASRGGLEAVWTEIRVVDGVERREARCRMCLARAQTVSVSPHIRFLAGRRGAFGRRVGRCARLAAVGRSGGRSHAGTKDRVGDGIGFRGRWLIGRPSLPAPIHRG